MSVFIVAEAGVNHLGDRAKMLALCDAAKAAGADAVKFQAYNTWALMKRRGQLTHSMPTASSWGQADARPAPEHMDTFHLLVQSELKDADLDAIAAHCKSIGIKWFASVFDPSQIERVLSRGACALKIGHAEAGWMELEDACEDRSHMVPCFISDVFDSEYCYGAGLNPVLCSPHYPADGQDPHLGAIPGAYIGFSSHYTDYRIPAAAALRGAEYIEAHLMLGDRASPRMSLPGGTNPEPEAGWSLSPRDFAAMVKLIREYESWL